VLLGRLSATVAALQCVVLTGNLGMPIAAAILAGLTLHEMSVFYRERRGAALSPPPAQLETTRGI
jgi:NAD(P)H-quinone oxidoreductase subunit 5